MDTKRCPVGTKESDKTFPKPTPQTKTERSRRLQERFLNWPGERLADQTDRNYALSQELCAVDESIKQK